MWRLEGGRVEAIEDLLVRETSLELYVNDVFLQSLKCLPTDMERLAVGFLVSEGYLSKRGDLVSLELCSDDRTVKAVLNTPPEQMERARLLRERAPEIDPVTHFISLMQPAPDAPDRRGSL
jgi:FdhD protein